MLDKRCFALLNIINQECVDKGYKIFSVEELIQLLPKSFGVTDNELGLLINTLIQKEYISVKYFDQKEVCLCPLNKGRLVFENKIDVEIEKVRTEKRYFAYSFLGGLVGAFLAGIIAVLIFLLRGI